MKRLSISISDENGTDLETFRKISKVSTPGRAVEALLDHARRTGGFDIPEVKPAEEGE